jgi:ParB family transcriptional regulator, chromosome partitioning protein
MKGLRNLKSTSVKPTIDTPQSSRLPLDQITDRPGGDTRPLNPAHVQALAESIATVGLIQPIAVDSQGRLLAGGHRRAAIVQIQATNPPALAQWFSTGVPVHRFDFDASQDEARALAIEASENEKRRDYSAVEVRALADRLVAAGYHHSKGQPKKGAKALMPALETIVGKSRRQIQRHLSPDPGESNRTDGALLFDDLTKPTARSLQRLIDCDDCPDDVRSDVLKLLKKLGNSSKS